MRQGSFNFDDPLDDVAGRSGARAAAAALTWGVLLKTPPAVRKQPFIIISSPLTRCVDTAVYVAAALRAAGFAVEGNLRIANCLAEETSNLLRYFSHQSIFPRSIVDLLPMHEVLKRGPPGVEYMKDDTSQDFRVHTLDLPNTNQRGLCKRMLDCVDWCKATYPDHNLVIVGHLHLVMSQLLQWQVANPRGRVGFAAFTACLMGRDGLDQHRWFWPGIPTTQVARGRRVQVAKLVGPVMKLSKVMSSGVTTM